ncbi:MAG: DUF1573 domain-containing protein [bacterium]
MRFRLSGRGNGAAQSGHQPISAMPVTKPAAKASVILTVDDNTLEVENKMTRNAVLLSLTLIAFVAGTAPAGPMLKLSERQFDWGRTCQNATVSHRFWIESTGDDTLVITKVVPGCGCTRAPLLDSILAPGEKTPLDIFFSTKSYRGKVSKSPYLETNIGDEKIYLKILSELSPQPDTLRPIFCNPHKVDVSQFRPNPPRRIAGFWIHNAGDRDYKITLIDHAAEAFEVKLPELVAAGDSVEVKLRVTDESLEQEFDHSITFSIDDDSATRYTVPVRRELRYMKDE